MPPGFDPSNEIRFRIGLDPAIDAMELAAVAFSEFRALYGSMGMATCALTGINTIHVESEGLVTSWDLRQHGVTCGLHLRDAR